MVSPSPYNGVSRTESVGVAVVVQIVIGIISVVVSMLEVFLVLFPRGHTGMIVLNIEYCWED